MKIWIDEEEFWPFLSEAEERPGGGHYFGWEIELTEPEIAEFRETMRRFHEWQYRLDPLIKAAQEKK